MGFYTGGLGPYDRVTVQLLQPVIISTLRKASSEVEHGGGVAESEAWFGCVDEDWMEELAYGLNGIASMINIQPIEVGFSPFQERKKQVYAAAQTPEKGWRNFFSSKYPMSTVHQKQTKFKPFEILLHPAWNTSPLYCSSEGSADSKFQTLVHECTHLLLGTEDYEYGINSCRKLAEDDCVKAIGNADNWGYFVEEFRIGD